METTNSNGNDVLHYIAVLAVSDDGDRFIVTDQSCNLYEIPSHNLQMRSYLTAFPWTPRVPWYQHIYCGEKGGGVWDSYDTVDSLCQSAVSFIKGEHYATAIVVLNKAMDKLKHGNVEAEWLIRLLMDVCLKDDPLHTIAFCRGQKSQAFAAWAANVGSTNMKRILEQSAEREANDTIRDFPSEPHGYKALAKLRSASGQHKEAAELHRKALALLCDCVTKTQEGGESSRKRPREED